MLSADVGCSSERSVRLVVKEMGKNPFCLQQWSTMFSLLGSSCKVTRTSVLFILYKSASIGSSVVPCFSDCLETTNWGKKCSEHFQWKLLKVQNECLELSVIKWKHDFLFLRNSPLSGQWQLTRFTLPCSSLTFSCFDSQARGCGSCENMHFCIVLIHEILFGEHTTVSLFTLWYDTKVPCSCSVLLENNVRKRFPLSWLQCWVGSPVTQCFINPQHLQ